MSKKCIISVITITMNNYEGILETYKSIEEQLHLEIEWIIIDGNSTDETLTLISEIKEKYKIRYYTRKPRGIYDAIEYGISNANGEWIHILNAGDVYYNMNTINLILGIIKFTNKDILLFSYCKNNIIIKPKKPKLGRIGTCHQAIIYKRIILINYPFDKRFKIFADSFQMNEMTENNEKIGLNYSVIITFESGGVSEQKYINGLIEFRYIWLDKYGVVLGGLLWFIWLSKIFLRLLFSKINLLK